MTDEAAHGERGRPPSTVQVCVVVLGLLIVGEVAAWVVAQTLGPVDVSDDLFGVAQRVVLAVAGARFLWLGYRTARVLLALWAAVIIVAMGVFAAVGDSSGASDLVSLARGVLLAVLVVLLLVRPTRVWCHTGPEPETRARRAAVERRQRRAGLPWPRRVLAAWRDDRDARR